MMNKSWEELEQHLREQMNNLEVPLEEDIFPSIMDTLQRKARIHRIRQVGWSVAAAAVVILGVAVLAFHQPAASTIEVLQQDATKMAVHTGTEDHLSGTEAVEETFIGKEVVHKEVVSKEEIRKEIISKKKEVPTKTPSTNEGHKVIPGAKEEHKAIPGAKEEHKAILGANEEHKEVSGKETLIKEGSRKEIESEVSNPEAVDQPDAETASIQQSLFDDLYLAEDQTENIRKQPWRLGLASTLQNGLEGGANTYKPQMGISGRPVEDGATPYIVPLTTPTYHFPITFALQLQLPIAERWAVGTGVSYTFLSSSYDALQHNEKQVYVNQYLHYIGIPIFLQYRIIGTPTIGFYANLGGMVEKPLMLKYLFTDLSQQVFQEKYSVSGLQWSANLGLGLEYRFVQFLGLFVEPSLVYYFDCGQPVSLRTVEPLQLKLDLGFRFYL